MVSTTRSTPAPGRRGIIRQLAARDRHANAALPTSISLLTPHQTMSKVPRAVAQFCGWAWRPIHYPRKKRRGFVALFALLAVCCGACAGPSAALQPIPRPKKATATVAPRLVPIITLVARRPATPTVLPPTPAPSPTARPEPSPTPRPTATAIPTETPEPTVTTAAAEHDLPPTLAPPTETPTAGPRAVIVSRGPSTGNAVALTYDAGADRGDAARLLAYLEDQNINVTFGMTGQWAESNPDLVRRLVADGDQLMNHTYDHRSFTGFSAKPAVLTLGERLDEIEKTDAILQALVGGSAKPFFRPPYGDEDPSVLEAAAAAGYRYSVLWTVDTLGWRGLPAPQIVDRSLRLAEPGAIYVLHVGALSQDIEATPAIVEGLRARGYRFVTLEQLIEGTTR